MNKVTNLNFQY